MKVKVQDIREKMAAVLSAKGYSNDDVNFLIEMYLGGELRGHTSHGLASFGSFVSKDFSGLEKPEVLKKTHAMFMIDAKSNPGALVGKRAADEAIKIASKEGVGTAIIKNMDSWLRPGAISQYVAEKGFVALVTNNGGGAAIAPPGGYDPVTGTNPLSYGIPTANTPLVVDLATSKRAWGQVRLANKYGTHLPEDTFYDEKGSITVDPKDAYSVKAFGDYKGFSLALLVEVLCGSLVGMDMLVQNNAGSSFGAKMLDRGAVVIVIDPSQTTDSAKFTQDNTEYIEKIKSSRSIAGQEIRIPGEEASIKQQTAIEEDLIDLPSELWKELSEL